jgi:ribosomal protein S18 acetylase RimI-like enzyme
MADTLLRDATAADAPVILDVLRAANEEYLGIPGYTSGSHQDTVAGTRSMMAEFSVVLAIANGQIVGCVFYTLRDDHCLLFRLGVLPAYRHRGIGRALVEEIERRAHMLGSPCVRLGVRRQFPWNRDYYERLGYRTLPEATETGYMMEKRL